MRPPSYSTKSLIIIWNNHKNEYRSTISDSFRYLTKNLIHIYSETKPTWKVWQNIIMSGWKVRMSEGWTEGEKWSCHIEIEIEKESISEMLCPHKTLEKYLQNDLIVWPGQIIKCIVSHSPTYLFYLFFSFNSFLYLCLCYRLIFLIIEKRSR